MAEGYDSVLHQCHDKMALSNLLFWPETMTLRNWKSMNRKRAPMTGAKVWIVALAVIACRFAVGQGTDNRAPHADAPKGKWGRVTPIADGNHPNLYYDRGEIEEL